MTSQELKSIIAESARLRAEAGKLRSELRQKIEESVIARTNRINTAKINSLTNYFSRKNPKK